MLAAKFKTWDVPSLMAGMSAQLAEEWLAYFALQEADFTERQRLAEADARFEARRKRWR